MVYKGTRAIGLTMTGFIVPPSDEPQSPEESRMGTDTPIPLISLCLVAPVTKIARSTSTLPILRKARKTVSRSRCRQVLVVSIAVQV